MANQVYANGREISCKAADGKSIAAFPDVCFTPPQTPATPPGIPIPYPNTGVSSDTSDGSKNVKISGKEIMMKDSSPFSKTSGNEAGNAPKKGVVTSKNTGKAFFNSWSMDVKVEGSNVVRHLDMMTHNHGSKPGNTPPWLYKDEQHATPIDACQDEVNNKESACSGKKTREQQCASEPCKQAKRCLFVSQTQGQRRSASTNVGCCDGEQAHHLIEAHCFYDSNGRDDPTKLCVPTPTGKTPYKGRDAPCVCATGSRHEKEHGQYHAFMGSIERAYDQNGGWNYGEAKEAAASAHTQINPQCSKKCTEAQLDSYHTDQCGIENRTPLRTDPTKRSESQLAPRYEAAQAEELRKPLNRW